MTLLENAFPYADVARLVLADRRSPDPAYQAHRWWARRPPALLRAVLLAASGPYELQDFWRSYADEGRPLDGVRVEDPFFGGGTTLVEAARLGACAVGIDVDPMAVLISKHQLAPPSAAAVVDAGSQLRDHLQQKIGFLWPARTGGDTRWDPLHYFFVAEVTCAHCTESGPLYRSLVLGRSVGHAGSVVRDVEVTAFCPTCFAVHDLEAGATSVTCCGQTRLLSESTFTSARYACPACGDRSSHEQLQTGAAPRRLIAVEETPVSGSPRSTHRRIRTATSADVSREVAAMGWMRHHEMHGPEPIDLITSPSDGRPISFGVRTSRELHTARQWLYLTLAHDWLARADLDEGVRAALRLAVSTTITSNNRLCGYATDYGRLAPLFSVRAFSLPWLTVELNPLNETGGRGTLAAAVSRVVKSCGDEVRRHVLSQARVVPKMLTLNRSHSKHIVTHADSTTSAKSHRRSGRNSTAGLSDVCVTDPPFYDFISYDALSQVFRAWLPTTQELAGAPLLPDRNDPVGGFGRRLGTAFSGALDRCKPGAVLAFTYKGNQEAWDAVGVALDEAKLRVTALWPVLADPHMGHHTHEGNCEFDILVVARSVDVAAPTPASTHEFESWIDSLNPVRKVSEADRRNMMFALAMTSSRRGSAIG